LNLRKEILITIALSGWSIGLTVVAAGGELLGLARELIHAGAETSLLNLLDVQDQSAAQLMTSFYRHLVCGRTKTDALQQAMQQVWLEYPHPYHWAPFTLVAWVKVRKLHMSPCLGSRTDSCTDPYCA
jgi:hypothetical protein